MGTFNGNYLAPRVPYNESVKLFGTLGSVIEHNAGWTAGSGEFRFGPRQQRDLRRFADQYKDLEHVPTTIDETDPMARQLLEFREVVFDRTRSVSHLTENIGTIAAVEAIGVSLRQGGRAVLRLENRPHGAAVCVEQNLFSRSPSNSPAATATTCSEG